MGDKPFSPIFNSALASAIEKAVGQIPPSQRGKVELRITLHGIEAEAAIRLFKGAEAVVFVQRTKDDKLVGAKLKWVF